MRNDAFYRLYISAGSVTCKGQLRNRTKNRALPLEINKEKKKKNSSNAVYCYLANLASTKILFFSRLRFSPLIINQSGRYPPLDPSNYLSYPIFSVLTFCFQYKNTKIIHRSTTRIPIVFKSIAMETEKLILISFHDPCGETTELRQWSPEILQKLENYQVFELSGNSEVFFKIADLQPDLGLPCLVKMQHNSLLVLELTGHDCIIAFLEGSAASKIININNSFVTDVLKQASKEHHGPVIAMPQPQRQGEELKINNPDNNGKICQFSIRLMDATVIKYEFSENRCLLDIKRRLQQDGYMPNTLQDDDMISNYVQIGYLEKFRYAFFFPPTRHTFSESEELMRFKEIGLNSRVSLILRPDYNPSMQEDQEVPDMRTSWKNVSTRAFNMLQALYQFFDYGVDEAKEDLQDFTGSLEQKHYGAPHFLGTAPSTGSLVNIAEATDSHWDKFRGNYKNCVDSNYLNGSRSSTPIQISETRNILEE